METFLSVTSSFEASVSEISFEVSSPEASVFEISFEASEFGTFLIQISFPDTSSYDGSIIGSGTIEIS